MKMFSKENALIDYQSMQYRLIPRLARGIVNRFGAEEIGQSYFKLRKDLMNPEFRKGKILHALGTFLKSHMTAVFQRDLEEFR
jgi:hypothetical protein